MSARSRFRRLGDPPGRGASSPKAFPARSPGADRPIPTLRPFLPVAIGTAFLLGCATAERPPTQALRLGAEEFEARRPGLAGELVTVWGFLISAGFTGENLCLKVLIDDELRSGPDLLIARHGRPGENTASRSSEDAVPTAARTRAGDQPRDEPGAGRPPGSDWLADVLPRFWGAGLSDAWMVSPRPGTADRSAPSTAGRNEDAVVEVGGERALRRELAQAQAYLRTRAPERGTPRALVVQACKRPPTRANKKAAKHALEWLAPLKKPERVTRAPTLATLRRELQLFYLERSRTYSWTELEWAEISLTGTIVGREAVFEDEVMGGVDMVPYVVGVHDPHRRTWLFLDLTFDDSVAKEVVFQLFGDQGGLIKRAGSAAFRGAIP